MLTYLWIICLNQQLCLLNYLFVNMVHARITASQFCYRRELEERNAKSDWLSLTFCVKVSR